jgi:hypothetical protein
MRHFNFVVLLSLAVALAAAPARGANPLPDEGTEFLVNTFIAGPQSRPAIAAGPLGGLWFVWNENGQPPYGIKARNFDASGLPLGPELWVHSGNQIVSSPQAGTTPTGGFVAAWANSPDIWVRRFNPDGTPVGAEIRVDPEPNFASIDSPGLAVTSGGSFAVAWLRTDVLTTSVLSRRFDALGAPLEDTQTVASGPAGSLASPRLAGAADGGFLVVWQSSTLGAIFARRYDAASGTWSAATRVDGSLSANDGEPAAVLASDGSASVVWIGTSTVLGRHLSAAGTPTGPEVIVGENPNPFASPAIATDAEGHLFVLWSDGAAALRGQLLNSDLTPSGGVFQVNDPAFPATDPAVATTVTDGFAVAWTSGFEFHFPFDPQPPPVPGLDGNSQGIAGRLFGPVRCAAGGGVLCLGPGGQFQASVAWTNPATGESGNGHSLPLTADTGAFWFFGSDNLELMVKVLDGSAINFHDWVYAGALSNVEYTLTVTDILNGMTRSYHNPAGQFTSLADVNAFNLPVFDPPVASPRERAVPPATATVDPIVGCLPIVSGPPTSLCLSSGHFTVSVQFTDPRTGLAGPATAVPLTADTGAFWFFDDSNLELMIKVLDGRAINGKFWVFYGALSDVDYTITVTRPETGEVKTYHNSRGTLASHADTQAF